jgi:selT/selW/selH-like putative selenoprotein
MIDIAMRYFLGPGQSMLSRKKPQKPAKENKYENPLKDVEIDTSLDEDDDDFADTNKKKSKKTSNENEEEKEKEKKKKKKKIKNDDDEDEEDDREVITIIYDQKSFGQYYETLKNEIMGNFTNIDVEGKNYPLPSGKQFLSKFTFVSQMGISLLVFTGQKLKDTITVVPPSVFDGIEKNKWFLLIGNFFFHQWLNRNLATTGAFEIYYKDKIIFSKLASNKLPKEREIHSEIKKINKKYKNKYKGKKKKYADDDDDFDDDL